MDLEEHEQFALDFNPLPRKEGDLSHTPPDC